MQSVHKSLTIPRGARGFRFALPDQNASPADVSDFEPARACWALGPADRASPNC